MLKKRTEENNVERMNLFKNSYPKINIYTVEHGCKDIGLYDTSSIASDILWYQINRHC
jgi:hypothetical protein